MREKAGEKKKGRGRRIVFTGGHHNSALVVAKQLEQEGFSIWWFGHRHTMKDDQSVSLESREVERAGLAFIGLQAGKFYGHWRLLSWLRVAYGFFQSLVFLKRIKPELIIAFGGYLAFPVVVAGWLLGIDSFIHEQTSRAGLANRVLAPFASRIFLTWESSRRYFPRRKTKLIGLPLAKQFFSQKAPESPFANPRPIILVTGGKQGSHIINRTVEAALPELLKDFNLIHQTGGTLKTGDYSRLSRVKERLPEPLGRRYLVKKFFYRPEMIKMINLADLVVSRAGAHIVYELAAAGKPAILIPFPWAYQQEQLNNARILAKAGTGVIIEQKKLNPEKLVNKVSYLFDHLDQFLKNAGRAGQLVKKDAASQLVEAVKVELAE